MFPKQISGSIPRVLSVAPLKPRPVIDRNNPSPCIPRVLSVAPLKLWHGSQSPLLFLLYSTRPKRGPIEAARERNHRQCGLRYSTRPKRGPIKAEPNRTELDWKHCIPRVLSVAPLKRWLRRLWGTRIEVFHAS